MNQCKRDGCGSYAINDHKESGLCDKCYWIEQEEELTAERNKLKAALEEIKNLGIGDQMIYAHKIVDEALKESA